MLCFEGLRVPERSVATHDIQDFLKRLVLQIFVRPINSSHCFLLQQLWLLPQLVLLPMMIMLMLLREERDSLLLHLDFDSPRGPLGRADVLI